MTANTTTKTVATVPWADNKDDFLLSLHDGEWFITKDNLLIDTIYRENLDEKINVEHLFMIHDRAAHHTTDWLRMFCEEHHPEIDFDQEFETDSTGVFGRYQEKFGHDYEEWVNEKIYSLIEEKLNKLGYRFAWS